MQETAFLSHSRKGNPRQIRRCCSRNSSINQCWARAIAPPKTFEVWIAGDTYTSDSDDVPDWVSEMLSNQSTDDSNTDDSNPDDSRDNDSGDNGSDNS